MQSALGATRVTTHTKLHGFSRQFLPRHIRVHEGYGEFGHAARRAIVDQFGGPNWTAGGKILGLRHRQKFPRGSVEFLSTDWASDLRNALWANSGRIHDPEERELFAAQRTDSDKLKRHGALSLQNSVPLQCLGSVAPGEKQVPSSATLANRPGQSRHAKSRMGSSSAVKPYPLSFDASTYFFGR